ncbi:MAG: Asp-tRNA(Asn)/Glu-tRNA(Gln) amidotransferase subunit GatC [Rhodospirillales bacterium]|nr:Asp-tRNA(Asn)/Glu-tRNA(Gln) amidotransferase subunit GatC [Rhodospirillales bacterium]
MSLDKETVKTIAFLARVRVPDDQLEGLAGELSAILGWITQLGEVDTSDVEPMTSVATIAQHHRTDVVTDGRRRDAVLANAPHAIDDYYALPKVVE